jgi:hypothetical protein
VRKRYIIGIEKRQFWVCRTLPRLFVLYGQVINRLYLLSTVETYQLAALFGQTKDNDFA